MTCHEFEEQANLYIDGLLDEEASRRVEEHMAECPSCRAVYTRLTQVVEALGSLEELPLPEGFEEKLAGQLKPTVKKRSLWKHPGLWSSVAAVLVVMVVGLMGSQGMNRSEEDMAMMSAGYRIEETRAAGSMNTLAMDAEEPEMVLEEAGPISAGKGSTAAGTQRSMQVHEEKLIYTANVSMRSYSFDEDYELLKEKVQTLKGYIDSNSVQGLPYTQSGGSGRYGTLQLRVPQNHYQQMMDYLADLGEITSTQENVTNITQQYTETAIRVENLQKQITRLQELMEKAEAIEDIIALEAQLTEVTSELEYVNSQLAGMDHDVSYSTIHVEMQEMRTGADPLPKTERSFWQRMGDALGEGWWNFVSGLEEFALNIVEALPTLAVIAVAAAAVVGVVRKLRRRKK